MDQKEYQKQWYQKNKTKKDKQSKEWRKKNPEKWRQYAKNWRLLKENKKKIKENNKQWIKDNPKKYKAIQKRKHQKRQKTPQLRLRHSISNSITFRLKKRAEGKRPSILECLPYSISGLIEHLEKQFIKGMNWSNYGQWHIDHIKPDSLFNYKSTKDKEFQESWALENLQPMWAKENFKKGNKYEE